jgi:hypothetical protein
VTGIPARQIRSLMMSETLDKLTVLRREDHSRDWQSLDDERVCLLCGRSFTGRDVVVVTGDGDHSELHCSTPGCQSHPHQWVYPGNPLTDEKAYADWWKALGEHTGDKAQAV